MTLRLHTVLVVLAVVSLTSLVACGFSTRRAAVRTATVRSTGTSRLPAATRPSVRPCSAGVTANVHASCLFAESILSAYASPAAEKEEAGSETATVHLAVESPTTHETYAVACSQASGKRIDCHAGTDAVVTLTFRALIEARAHGKRLTPVQISNDEGALAQRPACGPTCHMTPSEKRAYEVDQNRKAQEAGWAFQWKREHPSETLEEAEREVRAAIRMVGSRAAYEQQQREGAELRASAEATRRRSYEEAQREGEGAAES